MWSGRFAKSNSSLMEEFNASIFFDHRLYKQDIAGSIAHVEMLAKQKIILQKEANQIKKSLKQIEKDITENKVSFTSKDEDIHMAIERELHNRIGAVAGKLHTGRSRNDQVSTDLRLYLREQTDLQQTYLTQLMQTLYQLATKNQNVILPGYTHLQIAQPITLSYFFLAYFFMFSRDLERLRDARERINQSPLGSGAFSGVNYKIDRDHTAKQLGFGAVIPNAMDAIADRDFVIEYLSALSIIMTHLSRINEEFILWSNKQFDFITIDDQYSTGSSIMPNKKNPDACELIRGKTGRVNGNLIALLTTLKALPLAYNKDLQEDKECVFDSIDQVNMSLVIFEKILDSTTFHSENMLKACDKGYLPATDIADYLVKKGLPFRKAHHVSGAIVLFLEKEKKEYVDLSLKQWQNFSPLFEKDILKVIDLKAIIENKLSEGSTSFASVKKQLSKAEKILNKIKKF